MVLLNEIFVMSNAFKSKVEFGSLRKRTQTQDNNSKKKQVLNIELSNYPNWLLEL